MRAHIGNVFSCTCARFIFVIAPMRVLRSVPAPNTMAETWTSKQEVWKATVRSLQFDIVRGRETKIRLVFPFGVFHKEMNGATGVTRRASVARKHYDFGDVVKVEVGDTGFKRNSPALFSDEFFPVRRYFVAKSGEDRSFVSLRQISFST